MTVFAVAAQLRAKANCLPARAILVTQSLIAIAALLLKLLLVQVLLLLSGISVLLLRAFAMVFGIAEVVREGQCCLFFLVSARLRWPGMGR